MTTLPKCGLVLALFGLVGCGASAAPLEAKSGLAPSDRGSEHAEVGKPAPPLSVRTVNGKGTVSLQNARGKILVVDFWATWCGPCRSSFPQLEALAKKSGDKVIVVGISVDDTPSDVPAFVKETGVTFPIGWDDGHALAERWQVKNMPTTFIVDPAGTVRFIHGGYHDGEAAVMERELAALADEGGSSRIAATEKKGEVVAASDRGEPKSEAHAAPATPPKKSRPHKRSKGGGKARPSKKRANRA